MGYCKEKSKRLWKDMQKEWYENDILKSDIMDSDFWRYDFDDNNEWSVKDFEQSPLSLIILGNIISMTLGDEFYYEINRDCIYLISNKDSDRHRVLFDVMNNSNYNVGKKCAYKYRRIGNFVPLPGKSLKRSLQFIHKDNNEQWDKMLLYLRKNWSNICNIPKCEDFRNYIKISCQQMYFKKVFEYISIIKDIDKYDLSKLWNDMNAIVDTLDEDAEIVKLNDTELIKYLIDLRGRIILERFSQSTQNDR